MSGEIKNAEGLDSLDRIRRSSEVHDLETGEVQSFPYWMYGGVRLRVYRNAGADRLLLQVSLPKRRSGSNLHLLGLRDSGHELQLIYEELGEYVTWCTALADLKVHRLDASMDFQGVTEIGYLIRGFAAVPVAYERNSPQIYPDAQRGHAITLARGTSNTFRASLYDKHAEVLHRLRRGKVPPPQRAEEVEASRQVARFEAQLHRPFLVRHQVETWDQVTEEAVSTMRKEAFSKKGFDRPVVGAPRLLTAMREDGLSPTRQGAILLEVLHRSLGMSPEGHPDTLTRNRKDLDRLGLTAADALRPGPSVWLDYDAACQRLVSDN